MSPSPAPSSLSPGSRVVLVDSSAILKGCFEGYPQTRTGTFQGRPMDTMALYGYLQRIRKLYEVFEFEALVHVMDPPGGSFYRFGLYPAYKGNRKEKNPVFVAQETYLQPTLEAFGERVVCQRGIEADDAIATLAEQLVAEGHQVLIVSPDKDLMQLVDDARGISLARYVDYPDKSGKTYASYEEAQVLDTFGVRADQVADFLALVGDTTDNIPGIHKCGPKTAAKWLADYGNIETLMSHAHEIPGKIGENLREGLPNLTLYQKLTNVLRDAPGIRFPETPEVTPEAHQAVRTLLSLDDTFPAQFRVGGLHRLPGKHELEPSVPAPAPRASAITPPAATAPTPAAAPTPMGRPVGLGRPAGLGTAPRAASPVASARVDPTPQVSHGLTLPAADPLEAGRAGAPKKETLGDLFAEAAPASGGGADDRNPFADLDPILGEANPAARGPRM